MACRDSPLAVARRDSSGTQRSRDSRWPSRSSTRRAAQRQTHARRPQQTELPRQCSAVAEKRRAVAFGHHWRMRRAARSSIHANTATATLSQRSKSCLRHCLCLLHQIVFCATFSRTMLGALQSVCFVAQWVVEKVFFSRATAMQKRKSGNQAQQNVCFHCFFGVGGVCCGRQAFGCECGSTGRKNARAHAGVLCRS